MSEGTSSGGLSPRGASATGVQERTTALGVVAQQLDPMRFAGMSEVSIVAIQTAGPLNSTVDIQLRVKQTWYTIGTVTIVALNTPHYLARDVAGRQVRVQLTPGHGGGQTVTTLLSTMA